MKDALDRAETRACIVDVNAMEDFANFTTSKPSRSEIPAEYLPANSTSKTKLASSADGTRRHVTVTGLTNLKAIIEIT